jgi:hypothetical protein
MTNLRSIYHPERREYDVAKMGFKTGAGKTYNQFVFDGSFLNCIKMQSLQILRTFLNAY